MMDTVVVTEGVVVSVDVEEVSGEAGTVDVARSDTEDAGLEEAILLVAETPKIGAVDVELTKSAAFST